LLSYEKPQQKIPEIETIISKGALFSPPKTKLFIMKKNLFLLMFLCSAFSAFAIYIPPTTKTGKSDEAIKQQEALSLVKNLSVEEFQEVTGKKLSGLQKWKYKKLHKRLNSSKSMGIIPEREDLTEGFQALPFFGSLFTLGIVAIVMFFTARDRNANNWAWNAVWLLSIVFAAATLIMAISGY
jgi:hypothetical protein